MNEYLFFTAEGTTYPPKKDKEVDNCQVLGKAKGKTVEEAKGILFEENSWIENGGFDSSLIRVEHIFTEEQKKDIQTLIEYLYEKEEKYYEECGCPQKHIFKIVQRLKQICF